jgi:ParB family chromosome partitioning protein
MTRPVIVNRATGTIIAGHQRVKALTALGIGTAPRVSVTISDDMEKRINQIHNAIEQVDSGRFARVPAAGKTGFQDVRNIGIEIMPNKKAVNYVSMLLAYGNIDSAVAARDGTVIKGFDYLCACKILNVSARVYYIENGKREEAGRYLFEDYGMFDYEGKNDLSFQQCKAQMKRLSKGENTKQNKSKTYTKMLETEKIEGKNILDFGCGRADYANRLKQQGVSIIALEFFRAVKGRIDFRWTDAVVQKICEKIKATGLFDIVICDSVLNSVVSLEAESDVLNCLNAFAKPGGKVYFSGRCLENAEAELDENRKRLTKTTTYQLDDNGFSASFNAGNWYYQKFHNRQEILSKANKHGLKTVSLFYDKKTWIAECVKASAPAQTEIMASVEREFNMRYSPNRRYDNAEYVMAALGFEKASFTGW